MDHHDRRFRRLPIRPIIVGVAILVCFAVFALAGSVGARADERSAEHIARQAMSTASLWMIEHHEHEIAEALERNDIEEAAHEAEELISWIEGTAWVPKLTGPAQGLTAAVNDLVAKLKAGDRTARQAAFDVMKKNVHHLHHELMEDVADQAHGHGN